MTGVPVFIRIDLDDAAIARDMSSRGLAGDIVRPVTRQVYAEAVRRAPRGGPRLPTQPRTEPTLVESLQWDVEDAAGAVVGRVWTDNSYANIVINGRGWVYPVNKKALAFMIGGQALVRMKARPAAGQPFLWEALNAQSPFPVSRG